MQYNINNSKKIIIVSAFLLLTEICSYAQKQNDSIEKNNILYSKWKISIGVEPEIGFNLGAKITPLKYSWDMSMVFGHYSYCINLREKGNVSCLYSFDILSPSFLKKLMNIRIGIDFARYHYTGIADLVHQDIISDWPPPPIYRYDTIKDAYKYYFKDYIFSMSVIPEFNYYKRRYIRGYYFLGTSIASCLKEVTNYESGKPDLRGCTAFGITGFGLTFKLKKDKYLDAQLHFTSQIFTTPAKRRLASLGIKFGFMF
jgi:hypothetical protein